MPEIELTLAVDGEDVDEYLVPAEEYRVQGALRGADN